MIKIPPGSSFGNMKSAADPDSAIFKAGRKQGRQDARQEVLTHLQQRFMGVERTDTPEAQAILLITREISQMFKAAGD